MEKELKGQVAVVTGGNSGIGRAISIDLAQKGAKVMILARNEAKNEEVENIIIGNGGEAETYTVDITNKGSVEAIINEIHKKHGQIDILICNAGNSTNPSLVENMSKDDFDSVMKTHIYGTMNSVQACARKMKARKYGRIVLMSSLGGYHGMACNANYAIAKHGLVGLTYTLAKELGSFGVTVNALQPGIISSPMTDGLLSVIGDKFSSETPVKRNGTPEDVAYATSFLCNPKAGFINGVLLRVDGGFIIESGMDRAMMGFLG